MTYEDVLKKYGLSAPGQTNSRQNNTASQSSSTAMTYEDVLRKYGLTGNQQQTTQDQNGNRIATVAQNINSYITDWKKHWGNGGTFNTDAAKNLAGKGRKLVDELKSLREAYAGNQEAVAYLDNLGMALQNISKKEFEINEANTLNTKFQNAAKTMDTYAKRVENDEWLNENERKEYGDAFAVYANAGDKLISQENGYTEEDIRKFNDSKAALATQIANTRKYFEDRESPHAIKVGKTDALSYDEAEGQAKLEQLAKEMTVKNQALSQAKSMENYLVMGDNGEIDWDATARSGAVVQIGPNGTYTETDPYIVKQTYYNLLKNAGADGIYSEEYERAKANHEYMVWAKKDYQYLDLMEKDNFAEIAAIEKEKDPDIEGRRTNELYGYEKNIYYYIRGTEGQEAADKFIDHMENKLKARRGAATARWINSRYFSGAAASIYGFGTGIAGGGRALAELVTDLDPAVFDYANTDLQSGNYLTEGQKKAHQVGMTVGQQVPALVGTLVTGNPAVGRAISTATAFGVAEQQGRAMGMTSSQSKEYALLNAAGEALLSQVSDGLFGVVGLDDTGVLSNNIKNMKSAWGRVSANFAVKGLGENLEEVPQDFLEPLFVSMVTGKEYEAPEAADILETILMTYITTGIMDAPTNVTHEVMSQNDYKKKGAEIIKAGGVEALKDQANKAGGVFEKFSVRNVNENGTGKGQEALVGQLYYMLENAQKLGNLQNTTVNNAVKAETPAETTTTAPMDVYESTLAAGTNASADPVATAIGAFNENGNITNKQIQDILNSTTALDQLREKSGNPIKGTTEERSNAVREAVAKLAQETNAEPETTNADVSTPATDMEAVESMARPSSPTVETDAQKNAVSEETTVTVKGAGSAINEQSAEKNTLGYRLASNLDQIQDMEPVKALSGKEFNDRSIKLPEQIANFFKSLGNKVMRIGLGKVELGEYGVGGMMNHRPLNRAKLVSLAAVPEVIENGRQIGYEKNWKGRGYDSFIFAAPVTVNGTKVYVAAVVDRRPDNKFYLSEMVDSDGNYVRIEESPSSNSKNGVTDGASDSGKVGFTAGPEGLSRGGNPSTTNAEPTPLLNESIPKTPPVVNTVSEISADSTETDTPSPTESVGDAPSVISDAGTDIGTVKTGNRETATGRSAIYSNTYENASGEGTRTVGEMAKAADPNIDKYEKVTEKESVESAVERTGDPEKVNAAYEELINKTGWTGEDNDTAFFALNYFRKTGEIDKLTTLARRQREEGTRGAQLTQSFAKYTRMTATDCVLDVVEQVDSLNKSDVPRRFYKDVGFEQWKMDVIKTANDIANQIDNVADGDVDGIKDIIRTLAQFRNTTAMLGYSSRLTKIAEAALKDIDFETAKAVANAQLSHMSNDFVKRPAGQIIKTIRIHNMLASLVTFGRNMVSNAATGILDATSDSTVGRGLDALMSLATGKRTVGNDIRYAKDYLKGAVEATKLAALCVELDIPLDSESRFQEGATRTYSPKGNPVTRFMGAFEKLMRYSLDVSDQSFSGGTNAAVKKSLENLGEKSNLTEEEISGISSNVGKRRTFKEDRMLTKASKSIKTGLNKIGTGNFGLGDVMMPFVGTTSNVTQTAIDYSTLGIGGFIDMFKIMRDVKNGKYKDGFKATRNGETISLAEAQRQAVTTAGRGLTGAGLIAGFTALAAKGIIGVHDDEDKDKRDLEQSSNLSGAQLNIDAAIRWFKGESTEWREGDWTVSVDFLEPANAQMYLGYLLSQDDSVSDMIKSYPGKAATSIFQAILDMPAMQGVSDLNDALTKTQSTIDDEEASFGDKAEEVGGVLLGNTASGFIPAWLRQIAQYNDPYYRDTTGDSAGERAINQVTAQIPGLSKTLPKKYDGFGKVQRRYEEGDEISGFLNTFVLPGKVKKVSTTEVTDYLDDLYDRTGNVSFYPSSMAPGSFTLDGEKISISGKEATEKYQSTYGNKVNELYSELISNDVFQSLTDDQQVEILNSAKKYAVQVAKASVSDYSEVPSYIRDRPEGMTEADAIFANAITSNFESTLRSLTESWKKGKDNETAVADLEGAWTNFQNMSPEMQEAVLSEGGRVKEYITARQSGMSAEDFAGSYRVEYTTGNAFDSLTASWKKGEDNTTAAGEMEDAWTHYQSLSYKAKNALKENLTGRDLDYITARESGISAETFTSLYKTYYSLKNSTDKTANEKAAAWSLELERAQNSGNLTSVQKNVLKDKMYFTQSLRAKSAQFDEFVQNGIPAEKATYVDAILKDLTPKSGKSAVTDIQRIEAVANADRYLTESQQRTAMKSILDDTAYAKYLKVLALGMDTDDYAESYRIYLDLKEAGGERVKARTIEEFQNTFDITYTEAKDLYEIYKPK